LKHLLGPVHVLAEMLKTEAAQQVSSAVEIPPAVQSASVLHSRVVEYWSVSCG